MLDNPPFPTAELKLHQNILHFGLYFYFLLLECVSFVATNVSLDANRSFE